uniref:Actin interacting protein 3-like C-terminal domain-containing protein n=1 Tax=Bombyx mori TaxID=7091 RepID=A0A8R2QTC8_BOMMO|nr:coiled-coil domain-containing protein AGAP005037 isoform X4 [Bombyx mori]
MSENNKKKTGSFRKLFPNLFFSSKTRGKTSKDSKSTLKCNADLSISNQYQSPRSIRSDKYAQGDDSERIYENLTTTNIQSDNETLNIDIPSNHSSSSTLVSESVKNRNLHLNEPVARFVGKECSHYAARPQVPPKPQNEMVHPTANTNYDNSLYPDVYYHSLEKLSDKISPLDEIEIYKASQAQVNPASVGAEIKRVSTKFLISPKKEAEVRTIQPTRARSLSLEKEGNCHEVKKEVSQTNVKKPYNYSAPTSPMPVTHKIPSMPKTVSPYGHLRRNMIEIEEKRNSLNRTGQRNRPLSPSRSDFNYQSTPTSQNEGPRPEENEKEKTRQKVEAFYWQKLREMRQKEDEYLLKQSLRGSARNASTLSNCSSPNSFTVEPRSYSLPRGQDFRSYTKQPVYAQASFKRGAPERRTDTFIKNRSSMEPEIIYRNPEKLLTLSPISLQERRVFQPDMHNKQVNLEEQNVKNNKVNYLGHNPRKVLSAPQCVNLTDNVRTPPLPPVRTTSVGVGKKTHVINNTKLIHLPGGGHSVYSESESGSEAGEIQRIFNENSKKGGLSDGEASRGPVRGRPSRRDDPRRHTLAGNHLYVHPHHPAQINSLEMELPRSGQRSAKPSEYASVMKPRASGQSRVSDPRMRKPPLPRSYPPPTNSLLYDEDPGIMSEVETASTGFRRGGKQRSSLPVVRTPSKTLERPLGLVFLQYRNETKRALLPNEITSIDTVKALFVRSFPKQLTMQYMDSPMVKIYIHDSSKDMFYELEDERAHLHDIRDRSVLRLFEATDIGGGAFPGVVGVGSLAMPPPAANCSGPSSWDQDQSYFSEPEIDSEYHHQHVHKTKVKAPAYYMGNQAPSTLPRGGSMLRAFSPAGPPVPADRVKTIPVTGPSPAKPLRAYVPGGGSERCFPFTAPDCARAAEQLYTIPGHSDGYMSSPERSSNRQPYEDPYYTQFLGPAAGRPAIAPIIDEEAGDTLIIDDSYQMYGVNPITTAPRPMPRPPYDARIPPPVDELQRIRVEKMERQLANLTGLVQKALQVPGPSTATPPTAAPRQELQNYGAARQGAGQDAASFTSNGRLPKLGRDKFQKSVSFEKSVSFSDDPPDMNSPKQHSPQHSADTKPAKPAIKSSTLPRTSSQERDRLKPAPPPKPAGLVGKQNPMGPQKIYTINVTSDFFGQLRVLQKQSRDLRIETRNLRRSTLTHAIQMRQMMAETIVKIGELAATFCDQNPDAQLTREEEMYRQDMLLLENDLYELEATVERLRGQAANSRETRVNMADIERIAMVLSKSSKTVADWKLKFPVLQDTMKTKLSAEMEKVVRKEKILEDEPERLELALRRCKKLTGTLVTLKRLACVQEQRLPMNDGRISPESSQSSTFTACPSSEDFNSDSTCPMVTAHNNKGPGCAGRGGQGRGAADVRPENALDALLDELQTFAKPCERGGRGEGPLRRLHSYPSGSDTDASPPVRARGQHPPKPPVPERHPELLAMAARRAPPPPPPRTTSRSPLASPTSPSSPPRDDSESCPTDPNATDDKAAARQNLLEQRHQELLKKQKALQEQYARLQMIQRSGPTLPPNAQPDLKKTGSESNLLTKMNLNLAPANLSGSMTHLASDCKNNILERAPFEKNSQNVSNSETIATTNKVYETDIL